MPGQINRGSRLGDYIYDLVLRPEISRIVEIGTWNGLGSTMCIREAITDSRKAGYSVHSLEANKKMHRLAVKNHRPPLANFQIVHGRVIDDVPTEYDPPLRPEEKDWLRDDLAAYRTSPNVRATLPETIDLLILDGGEFTSEQEFRLLAPRSRHIIMDDTCRDHSRKFCRIRDEILAAGPQRVVVDAIDDRNGWMHVQ